MRGGIIGEWHLWALLGGILRKRYMIVELVYVGDIEFHGLLDCFERTVEFCQVTKDFLLILPSTYESIHTEVEYVRPSSANFLIV